MKKILFSAFFLLSNPTFAGEWSRYIISENRDDVTISFRQQKKHQAWLVEWSVNNKSEDQIEPLLMKRNYICADNKIQELGKISLGIYPSHSKRNGDVTDINICPNSTIKLVEIETEIRLKDTSTN